MMINVDWRLIYSEACSPRSRYSGEEVIKQTVHLNKSEWYNIQELYCQTQHQDGCRLSRQLRPVDPLPRQLRVHCEYKSVRGRKWPHDTFLFYCFFLSISRHLRPWQAMRDCWIIFLHCRFDDNLQLPFILRKIFLCAHSPHPSPVRLLWAVILVEIWLASNISIGANLHSLLAEIAWTEHIITTCSHFFVTTDVLNFTTEVQSSWYWSGCLGGGARRGDLGGRGQDLLHQAHSERDAPHQHHGWGELGWTFKSE